MVSGLEDPGIAHALDGLQSAIDRLVTSIDHLDKKVDDVAESKLSKTEFNTYKDVNRKITMWGIGMVVTVVLANLPIVVRLVFGGG